MIVASATADEDSEPHRHVSCLHAQEIPAGGFSAVGAVKKRGLTTNFERRCATGQKALSVGGHSTNGCPLFFVNSGHVPVWLRTG